MRARAASLTALVLLTLLALAPATAWAHGLQIDLFPEGEGRIRVEAFFTDGAPCGEARVSVRYDGGAVFREGTTDAEGAFTFEVPPGITGPLHIEVNDGAGHLASKELTLAGAPAAGATPRAERGAVQWTRVAIGMVVIFALGVALFLWQRRRGADGARDE